MAAEIVASDPRARIDLVDLDQRIDERRIDAHQRHRPLEEQLARDCEQLGTLDIVTATTGPEPDADGYAVSVDDAAAEPVGANAVLRRPEIAAGTHTVELTGLAANCTVSGSARRSVTVSSGEVTTASYAIACAPTTGTIAARNHHG